MLNLQYPILLIKSTTKRSFEALGRLIDRSGDTIARNLAEAAGSYRFMQEISQKAFNNNKVIFVSIDDTLIKKMFSMFMEGSGYFFDSKLGRRIMAYRLMVGMATDGHYAFPIAGDFLFSKELFKDAKKMKFNLFKKIVLLAYELYPDKKIIIVADGAFPTIETLTWLVQNNIRFEMRLAKNRVIDWKGKKIKVRDIKKLYPKGRQMSRTIQAQWHNLNVFISAERRIDKHGEETFVYQIANYEALPNEHVKTYKRRWPIEKFIRTSKQYLGLQECFSTKIETQKNHVASVFLAYAIAQLEMKKRKLKTPEEAIRALKKKNVNLLLSRIPSQVEVFAMG